MLRLGRRRVVIVLLALLIAVPPLIPTSAQEATDPDEGELRVVDTETIELGELRPFALSPDGQRLAAARSDELCVIDVATGVGNERQSRCADLRGSDIRIDLDPDSLRWSPDSSRLAFTETAFRTLMDGDSWVMDADSGRLTNLTDDGVAGEVSFTGGGVDDPVAHVDVAPAWSPDSESIAFARSTVRGGEWDGTALYQVRVTADGSATPQRITQISPEMPGLTYLGVFWTPDGERLTYPVLHPDRDHILNGIWSVGLVDGQPRRLLNFDSELGRAISYALAATGDHAITVSIDAFVRFDDDGASPFALVNLTMGQSTPIAAAADWTTAATFSPDGQWLLYSAVDRDAGIGQLIVRDVATGAERTLVPALAEPVRSVSPVHGLDWSEDGTVLLVQNDAVSLLQLAGKGAVLQPPAPESGVASPPIDNDQDDVRIVESETVEFEDAFLLSLSPDGQTFLTVEASDNVRTLCVIPVAARIDRRCAELPGGEDTINIDPGSVVWSPDSSWLAFAELGLFLGVDGDLWIMDASSAALTNLTDDGFIGPLAPDDDTDEADPAAFGVARVDTAPAWSPDGQSLAFVRDTWHDGEWTETALYGIAVATDRPVEPERIVTTSLPLQDPDPELRWSPATGVRWTMDGQRLLYTIANPNLPFQDGLWSIDIAVGQPRRLAITDQDLGVPVALAMVGDDDDLLIAYLGAYTNLQDRLQEGESGVSPYAIIDLASGEITPVVATTGVPVAITVSPDQGRLLYATFDVGSDDGQLIIRDINTGAEQTLLSSLPLPFDDGTTGFGLAWTTDDTIVFRQGESVSLLYVAGTGAMARPDAPEGSSSLAAGMIVVVANPDVVLRAAPALEATTVASLAVGTALDVLGPSITAAGAEWVPVREPATRTIGYVLVEDVDVDATP